MVKYNILFVVVVFISACTSTSEKIKNFIPGIYIRSFDNEFYHGTDTLKIEQLTQNHYKLIDYGSFLNKTSKKIQYSKEVSQGVYQEKEQQLYDTRFGKMITLDPDKKILYVGATLYKKVE